MDRFNAMRVFARIVERRSFTQAADDLGLPRSSVTDAVKGFGDAIGGTVIATHDAAGQSDPGWRGLLPAVCTENLSSGVVVMKSAQDGA